MQVTELNISISNAVPHIFKRPLLTINPSDSLMQVATFLAIGPQIYVDGLVVIEDNKAVGTIGGQHLVGYILSRQDGRLDEKASTIMTHTQLPVQSDAHLNKVLDIFDKTRFAFCPVTRDGKVVASISSRDILKVVEKSELRAAVGSLSSPRISINKDASIGNALEVMLEKGIRSLTIRKNAEDKDENETAERKRMMMIINDRKILEFLLSHEGREIIAAKGFGGLFDIKINTLDPLPAKTVRQDMPANEASKLFDVSTPCLLVGDDDNENEEEEEESLIVTPWDIIMRGFRELLSSYVH